MLLISNFSLFQKVFCILYLKFYNMNHSYPFSKQALVLCACSTIFFENTLEKEEIARNKQFPLFSQCFLHFWEIFLKIEIIVCKLFQFGRVLIELICHLQMLSNWTSL